MMQTYKETRVTMRGCMLLIVCLALFLVAFKVMPDNEIWGVALLIAAAVSAFFAVYEQTQIPKRLARFINTTGTFEHLYADPITVETVVSKLESMGFAVTPYFMGNYHCVKQLDKHHQCKVFVQNHNTPDCPEAEEFSMLYIQEMLILGLGGQRGMETSIVSINFGSLDLENDPEYYQTLRQGLTITKHGISPCFWTAYDIDTNILYFADAMKNVIWNKNSVAAKYMVMLMTELFGVKTPFGEGL